MNITKDKYIDFFIENFADIQALIEISNYSKSNLPSILDKEMHSYIPDTDFNNNIDFQFADDTVYWFDSEYHNIEQDKGPFFGYSSQWKSLFDGNDPGDASFLYLCVGTGHIKQKYKQKEYIDTIVKTLKKKSNELRKGKINFVNDIDYDDPYILKYPLHREFNMVTLQDREKLKKTVQRVITNFTARCLTALSD